MAVTTAIESRRNLLVSTGLLASLLLLGCAGFMLLDGDRSLVDAIWLTVNILTTVGDSHVPLTGTERVWAILLMLSGVLTVFYVGINLVAFIVDGELRALFGRRKLQNRINQLSHHVVVCGYGRMGRALCGALAERKIPFVLIETDADATAEADSLGFLYIHGDAMNEATLGDARIDHARGLAACLTSDADNVFVTLTARGLAPELSITARAESEETEEKLRRAGANHVICPPVLGAGKIMRMILNPAIDELLDLATGVAEFEVAKISVADLPGASEKSLRELAMPSEFGLMVVSITHADGKRQFNPPPDLRLTPDDEMIVIGSPQGVDRLTQRFGRS